MDTKQVIAKMLVENTGRHMLDSGGAYGRHWERNRGRKFASEPTGKLEFSIHTDSQGNQSGEIYAYLSTYHFLVRHLEYDPTLQRKFEGFGRRKNNEDEPWLCLQERFVREVVDEELGLDPGDVYTINTYNHESMLDQVCQYVSWSDNNGHHMLLSIHGGCDVRGGYTKPRCFMIDEDWLPDSNATIFCTGYADNDRQTHLPNVKDVDDGHHNWDTYDGGYHWEHGGDNHLANLESYDWTDDPEKRGKGTIYVDTENRGYCPMCGAALDIDF
jgi:hypothetical protein